MSRRPRNPIEDALNDLMGEMLGSFEMNSPGTFQGEVGYFVIDSVPAAAAFYGRNGQPGVTIEMRKVCGVWTRAGEARPSSQPHDPVSLKMTPKQSRAFAQATSTPGPSGPSENPRRAQPLALGAAVREIAPASD